MQATSIHFQPSILTCPQNAKKSSISYKASSWNQNFIESLKSDYAEDIYGERQKKLKEEVKKMIEEKDVKAVALIELIDNIHRLGLGYHFKNNIKRVLDRIVSFEQSDDGEDKSLHGTALRFRLLRQHGFDVSQDVFNQFKDHAGNFNACLSNDVKGLLSLYEATYLAFEGETLLDEAKEFSLLNLKHHVGRINDSNLADQVIHSLDLPLQRRMVRLQAREYIEAYSKREDANHVLLELAAVDFNMVQSKHRKELQDLTR
ncbi:isoprene synthase [Sarracenia purpurea var. burkii]